MPSPLIEQMIETHGYPVIEEDTLDSFLSSHEECVLFFTENPERFPESNDVAMILPELVKEYGHRFSAAVVGQKSQRQLQSRYGFTEWPSLVFLRDGQYLGTISRVQNWTDYLVQINAILQSQPQDAPGFGIPVVSA
ncbi:MAG: hypothetical protein D6720_02400 [Gammaproteobacteria bacterium]|nr:MAG: hypothetical protein D6720_02400 [Gammaproteobacteria bacterium]